MSTDAPDAADGKPKKKKKSRGKKGNDAEVLVQSYLERDGWVVHRAARGGFIRRGAAAFCQSHDLFGVIDLLAIQRENLPETWAVQVTTQNGRALRRKKIAAIAAWPTSWRVSLASHETIPDPANRTRKLNFIRIEDYEDGVWSATSAIPIDVAELEEFRRARRLAAEAASHADGG